MVVVREGGGQWRQRIEALSEGVWPGACSSCSQPHLLVLLSANGANADELPVCTGRLSARVALRGGEQRAAQVEGETPSTSLSVTMTRVSLLPAAHTIIANSPWACLLLERSSPTAGQRKYKAEVKGVSLARWARGAVSADKHTCSGFPTEAATAFDSDRMMSELSTPLPGTFVHILSVGICNDLICSRVERNSRDWN